MRANNGITLIQGDTFEAILKIDGLCCLLDGAINVIKCVFSVNSLDLTLDLEQVGEEEFSLVIPSDISAQLAPGSTNYDITIFLSDNTVKTVLYNQGFLILSKTNNTSAFSKSDAYSNNVGFNSTRNNYNNFGDKL